jgi:hypothetical protein
MSTILCPIIINYHLSIHHWQRDLIFLANTYAFVWRLSVFAKKQQYITIAFIRPLSGFAEKRFGPSSHC